MSFLITEIVLCLLAAAVIGLLLGWWLRHLSARSEVESLTTDWRSRVKVSELRLAEAAEQFTSLESQHQMVKLDLDTSRARQLELTTESDSLTSRVNTLIGTVKEKEQSEATTAAERENLLTKLAEAEVLASRLRDDSTARISGLEQELAEATERSSQTRKLLEAADSKVAVLTNELDAARTRSDSVQKALDASAGRVTSLQNELEGLSAKVAELEDHLGQSRGAVESSRRAFEQLRLDKDKRIAELQSSVEERDRLLSTDRQALLDAEGLIENLQSDRQSTDEMLATLEHQLSVRDEDLNALRSELTASERAIASLEASLNQTRHQSSDLERSLQIRDEELGHLKSEVETRGDLLRSLDLKSTALQQELSDLGSRARVLADEQISLRKVIDERDRVISELTQKTAAHGTVEGELRRQLADRSDQVSYLEGELKKLHARLVNLETDIDQRRQSATKLDDELAAARKRYAMYESSIHELTVRNSELSDLLNEARSRGAASNMITVDKAAGPGYHARPAWVLDRPSRGDKDDLKLVKGIGPTLEGMLNKLGVYYFEQVANFSTADVEWVTEQLDSFPDRVYRDRWIQQAATLHRRKLGETV